MEIKDDWFGQSLRIRTSNSGIVNCGATMIAELALPSRNLFCAKIILVGVWVNRSMDQSIDGWIWMMTGLDGV